jgi:hypothetical protein
MVASKENFFKAHWDWLVALGGVVALGLAAVYLFSAIGQSPEDAEAECRAWMDAELRKPHKGVDAVDLGDLQKVSAQLKTPPQLRAVDAKAKSFLASERRAFCQKGDGSDSKKEACGRPIPADLEVCPFCGMKQHVVKVQVDNDQDGLPNEWEKKYGLNANDAADADQDKDGDGFTNKEEFEAGTDPTDPKAHPDYLDSLSVAGALQQTFLPFWFQNYSPIPGGHRFTLRQLDQNGQDLAGYNSTWSVKKGEPIGKTGYAVTGFEKKSELRVIAGSKAGNKKNQDVSVLELTRAADGKKLMAAIGVRKVPVETQVELSYDRGKHSWKKTASVGTELDLNGEKFRVVSLRAVENGCEVKVESLKTKKQKVIR